MNLIADTRRGKVHLPATSTPLMPLCTPAGGTSTTRYATTAEYLTCSACIFHETPSPVPVDGESVTRVALVGCGSAKKAEPAPARELYTGQLFAKAARYAAICDLWFVLSAKHGLVHPDTVIAPYDVKLGRSHRDPEKDAPPIFAWAAAVRHALAAALTDVPNPHLVVLAGEQYRSMLRKAPGSTEVPWSHEVPMRGLGIGQQLAWLNANTP